MTFERRHELGGVEAAIRCEDAPLLDELSRPYRDFVSSGREPELVLEYRVDGGVDPELYRSRRHEIDVAVDDAGRLRLSGPRARYAIDIALRLGLGVIVPRLGGLILHAAGVAGPRGALLFTGPSGAGKSTIFGLLQASGAFPHRLSDELVFLRRGAGGWRAHGTPFAGDGPVPIASAPVRRIYLLCKSDRHRATPATRAEALSAILPQVRVAAPAEALDRALALVEEVPCSILEFAKDPGVVRALEEG